MGDRFGAAVRRSMLSLMVVAVGLVGVAGAAQASVLDTGLANDGVLLNFTGINWNNNGAAWVQGIDLNSSSGLSATDGFTVTYQAFADKIKTSSPTPKLYVASPGTATGTYEITTIQTLHELATCTTSDCSTVALTITGGSWDIYFDTSPDANQAAGTGFADGVLILSGSWDSGIGMFTATGPIPSGTGTGNSSVTGSVDFWDSAYFPTAPSLTMLQLNSFSYPGAVAPAYTRPTLIDGVSTGSDSATDFVVQADPLQTFSDIPEPPSFALALIGILAMGGVFRRTGQQL